MIYRHHDLQELDDVWWEEAQMNGFIPLESSYRIAPDPYQRTVHLIPIIDIRPVRRALGVGLFNDDRDNTAKERVVRLLRGFRLGDAIPPVEIVAGRGYAYKLIAGTHRLYCSLAVGFTMIPSLLFDEEHHE